jgi:hypothetical protein
LAPGVCQRSASLRLHLRPVQAGVGAHTHDRSKAEASNYLFIFEIKQKKNIF